jgi:hypothetical protein
MRETPDSIQSCVEKTPDGLSSLQTKMAFHLLEIYRVFTQRMTLTKNEDPSPQRIAEYELKHMELLRGGGHMIDFISLQNHYQDVIQFKNRLEPMTS